MGRKEEEEKGLDEKLRTRKRKERERKRGGELKRME